MSELHRLWMHRRHLGFPDLTPGYVDVPEEVAKQLVADECAQGMQTDLRHLRHPGGQPPFQPKAQEPEPKPTAAEETEVTPPPEVKPRRRGRSKKEPGQVPPKASPRSYKRRDLKAEG